MKKRPGMTHSRTQMMVIFFSNIMIRILLAHGRVFIVSVITTQPDNPVANLKNILRS